MRETERPLQPRGRGDEGECRLVTARTWRDREREEVLRLELRLLCLDRWVAALRECVVAFGLGLALLAASLGIVSPAYAAPDAAPQPAMREQVTLAVAARARGINRKVGAYWKTGAEKCNSCVSLGRTQLAATLEGNNLRDTFGKVKATTKKQLKRVPRPMRLKKAKKKNDMVLYSTFYHAVKRGKVQSVRFDDNSPKIYFQLKAKQRLRGLQQQQQQQQSLPLQTTRKTGEGETSTGGGYWFSTKRVPSDTTLLPLLISKKVSFGSRSSVSSSVGKVVLTAMLLWLPLVPLLLFVRRTIQQQQGMSKSNSKRKNLGGSKDSVPDVTFKDVAGADYAIEELREIVDFLHWKQEQVAERRKVAKKKGKLLGRSKYATAFLGNLNLVNLFQRIRESIRTKREKRKQMKTNRKGKAEISADGKSGTKSPTGSTAGVTNTNALNGFIKMPKGVLLSGPPGTGKTLLAKAVAGEASVPFFACSASEFVELFVGRGAARVRDLFKQARRSAPSIVFIDEIDAVGGKRGAGFNEERDQTLNQLLTELDGFNERNGSAKSKMGGDMTAGGMTMMGPDVLLICATNRPEVLDDALLRPGRLSRKVTIGLPDAKGRRDISLVYLAGLPLEPSSSFSPEVVERESCDQGQVDVGEQIPFENDYAELIASQTSGCSGADIANVVNEAVLMATRRGAQRVAEQDILAGIERTKNGIQRKSNMSAVGRLANNPIVASFEQMIASNMDKLKDTQQTIVRGQQRMP